LIGIVITEAEAFAERVFACELTLGEGLIDHGDAGGAGVILRREAATEQEGNLHRLQKVFAHLMQIGIAIRPGPAIR